MIFTELVLHNFGIYKGRHAIDLKPKSSTKPIILFGGLNGGGKTTFLDALQLTLYGKFAKCSNRGEISYNDYLKESINRHVNPKDGSILELEFIHYSDGNETTYRIKRFWKSSGKSINENMEVIKDGVFDPVMSEQWYEYVDEFFPSNISGLFFFDGEQIESLANPESSADILQTGIMSLLGLDLVDKLHSDLRTLERRRLSKQVSSKAVKTISKIEENIKNLEEKVTQDHEKLGNKCSEIDSLQIQINNAKQDYKKHGGELYEKRELIENQHILHEQQLKNTKENIQKYAEGAAPLLLVKSLVERAQKQSQKERSALLNQDILETLENRDFDIIGKFAGQASDRNTVDLLNKLLATDRTQRRESAKQPTSLNIHPNILSPFDKLFFADLQKKSKQLKLAYEHFSEQLAVSDRQLSTIPDGDMIKDVAQQLKTAEVNHKIAQSELNSIQNTYDEAAKTLAHKQHELDRFLHNANDEQLSAHQDKHVLEHIAEVRQTLMLYRQELINKHIGSLENLIKESFASLIRKSDLVQDIRINPEDFSLHIISIKGDVIPTARLSAGERQLLAISILWGLAKASGRPLPVIIDTPLGRLDSEHRGHLVDNYFPNASHQVILLSTDTEIDKDYRNDLSKSIGKEYHIQYQEKQQSSTITPGYF
ncbi:MAG: DNA sulfur modification protein DndD [Cycloclasticus sp.]|nr:MAG: DNA sulfur modification protein DndD [Cycloclasticus sp.]